MKGEFKVDINMLIVERFFERLMIFIPNLALSMFLFFAALYLSIWVAKLVRVGLERRETDPELTKLLSRTARWTVIVVGTVEALAQVNFDLGAFLTGVGILGFTVGFALQDIAKNFVAGILLLLQQPFDIGDGIEVSGYGGTVIDIEIRSTTLKTWDGKMVIIPTATVYTQVITNFTDSTRRRVQLDIGVAYGSDLERVTAVLLETMSQIEGIIHDDPAPSIYCRDFGQSAINLSLYFWVETAVCSPRLATDRAMKATKAALEQAGIEIPFPTRTVLLSKT